MIVCCYEHPDFNYSLDIDHSGAVNIHDGIALFRPRGHQRSRSCRLWRGEGILQHLPESTSERTWILVVYFYTVSAPMVELHGTRALGREGNAREVRPSRTFGAQRTQLHRRGGVEGYLWLQGYHTQGSDLLPLLSRNKRELDSRTRGNPPTNEEDVLASVLGAGAKGPE